MLTIVNEEGSFIIFLIVIFRIIILFSMAGILFKKWFNQEVQYISDIPFLFALFFLILAFGKFIDLFYNLMYFHFHDILFVLILKIRFMLIWLNIISLFLMTFEIWLFSLSLKDKKIIIWKIKTTKLQEKAYLTTTKHRIIGIIFTIETFLTIIMVSIETISILIVLAIPSMLFVSWLFYKAFKFERLTKVNTRLISIGFLLYSISTIARVIWQFIFGKTVLYIFSSEIVDVGIFLLIFYGLLYKKLTKEIE